MYTADWGEFNNRWGLVVDAREEYIEACFMHVEGKISAIVVEMRKAKLRMAIQHAHAVYEVKPRGQKNRSYRFTDYGQPKWAGKRKRL